MKYTIKNLKNDFPTDLACLDFIFKNRWPKGLTCPNCEKKYFGNYPLTTSKNSAILILDT